MLCSFGGCACFVCLVLCSFFVWRVAGLVGWLCSWLIGGLGLFGWLVVCLVSWLLVCCFVFVCLGRLAYCVCLLVCFV